MNCRQVDRILVKHLYGTLSEKAAHAVEEHLTDCAACRRRFDSFHRNRTDLTELTLGRSGSSLSRTAVSRWVQEGQKPAGVRNADWRRPLAWTAFATACLAIAIVLLLSHRSSPEKVVSHPTPGPLPTRQFVQHKDPSQPPEPTPKRDPAPMPYERPHSAQQMPRWVKASAGSPVDDMAYINADPVQILNRWVVSSPVAAQETPIKGHVARDTDDFIFITPPRIASADPQAIRAAMSAYQQQKAIVDNRLEKKVDLAVKGMAFNDLCKKISDATGIKMRASRNVADEKVTLFCDQEPLREIMRQITHVFGYTWARSGEENAFEYQLFQSSKLQIAEQALRDQDLNAALADLDKGLEVYKPFLEMSRAALLEQLHNAQKPFAPGQAEETPLQKSCNWGTLVAVQMLNQLTPAEREALRNGQEVRFSTNVRPGHGLLPPEMSASLLDTINFTSPDGSFDKNTPGAAATITLTIDQSELGQMSLNCFTGFSATNPSLGIGSNTVLAIGRSPATSKPDNRAANKELANDPTLQREVTLQPQSCKKPDIKTVYGIDFSVMIRIEDDVQVKRAPQDPHLNSADVCEELHKQTGMPIVADYYTHVFPTGPFLIHKKRLFDALCQVSDAMGGRWKKEGAFLQFRSTSFFWDKMKEVPNRMLDQWRKDRERNGSLPLDDLLEMAKLSDIQINSITVSQGIKHCLGLEEWGILDSPMTLRKYDAIRPLARFLSDISPSLRERAVQPEGVLVTALPIAQQEAFASMANGRGVRPASLEGVRLRILYVPSGMYVYPSLFQLYSGTKVQPIVLEKTAERAYEAAKKINDKVTTEDIRRSYGALAAILLLPDGTQMVIR